MKTNLLQTISIAAAALFLLTSQLNIYAQNDKIQEVDTREQGLDAISLKLSTGESSAPRTTAFSIQDNISFYLIATNRGSKIVGFRSRNLFLRYIPRLLKNGETLPFLQETRDLIEKAKKEEKEAFRFSGVYTRLLPNQEHEMGPLSLSKWYGQLGPGVYQLRVEFILNNEAIASDTLAFEITLPGASDKAISEKDKEMIRLGLKSTIFSIRQKAVEALAKLDDRESIPYIIETLRDNQGIIGGGTEADIMQNDLNIAIVSALEGLTKLKFDLSPKPSIEEIEKIIKKTEEWWKANKSKS